MDSIVTSRRNPLVRRFRSMATRAGRLSEGLVLLEGTHLLQELLRLGFSPVDVIATKPWIDSHPDLLEALFLSSSIRCVTEEVLRAAVTTVHPDGVACLCSLDCFPVSPTPTSSGLLLLLDRVQDPGNLGTLLRTALASDVDAVWIGGGADPLSPKALRSSAGTLLQLPHHRFGPDSDSAVVQLKTKITELVHQNFQVVAAVVQDPEASHQPIPYWQLDWTKPTALILGTEGTGLHPLLRACCTHAVTLPHSPRVESLNVAAAAVPLLLERRRATMSLRPSL